MKESSKYYIHDTGKTIQVCQIPEHAKEPYKIWESDKYDSFHYSPYSRRDAVEEAVYHMGFTAKEEMLWTESND